MKFFIQKINRTVDLDEEIANEYLKYGDLKDGVFMIAIRSTYGNAISEKEVSTEELSLLCNRCLIEELQIVDVAPKICSFLEQHYEDWTNGSLQEHDL